jgi:hypothetical protein
MYGIIGEAGSDAETLKVLIRRLANNSSLTILVKDYDGCGEILAKGARQLRTFSELGCNRLVVCHDADGPDPAPKRREINDKVVIPSGCERCCIVIPVHEIEAWILADIDKVGNRIAKSWNPKPFVGNPEAEVKPRKTLERMSIDSKQKPRYSHTSDNPGVALYLDLDRVRQRCPSFGPLMDFVRGR